MKKGTVTAVVNQKGGTGKTTTCENGSFPCERNEQGECFKTVSGQCEERV